MAHQVPREVPPELSPEPGTPSAGHHSHLWTLPGGPGVHAPPGQVVRDGTGRVCCHLCGRFFRALGLHVRVHGHTAASYRLAMGLCTSKPLTAYDLSATISRRQATAYRGSPALRDRLRPGQELARSGQLSWRARASLVGDTPPPERITRRRTALAAGRATTARRRDERADARLAALGVTSLADHLRRRYAAGAGLETLTRETGLGRTGLRAAMEAAGIPLRRPGQQPLAARRSRARAAEAAAAARVGTDDLPRWLAERHAEGWTLTRLAAAVGHTTHWVRWRLTRPERTAVPTYVLPELADDRPAEGAGS
jgi:hypothetical protein